MRERSPGTAVAVQDPPAARLPLASDNWVHILYRPSIPSLPLLSPVRGARILAGCPESTVRVLFAVGCVAPPRVVSATARGRALPTTRIPAHLVHG